MARALEVIGASTNEHQPQPGEPSDVSDSHAGQAVYSPFLLAVYDFGIIGFSNRFLWRCPSRVLLEHYNRNVGSTHLDVGVGTGYFLDHCRFRVPDPKIALFDLNPNSLKATAKRVRRYKPVTFCGDVLQSPPLGMGSFESIGMNYLLHCVPGTIHDKGIIFDHLAPHLAPGGIIFGSTVLNGGVEHGAVSQWVMQAYNKRGIFSNLHDDVAGLREILASRFDQWSVEVKGRVALFRAAK